MAVTRCLSCICHEYMSAPVLSALLGPQMTCETHPKIPQGEICSHKDLGLAPGFVTVWSQASSSASLSLNFLTYEMGIIIVPTYQVIMMAK